MQSVNGMNVRTRRTQLSQKSARRYDVACPCLGLHCRGGRRQARRPCASTMEVRGGRCPDPHNFYLEVSSGQCPHDGREKGEREVGEVEKKRRARGGILSAIGDHDPIAASSSRDQRIVSLCQSQGTDGTRVRLFVVDLHGWLSRPGRVAWSRAHHRIGCFFLDLVAFSHSPPQHSLLPTHTAPHRRAPTPPNQHEAAVLLLGAGDGEPGPAAVARYALLSLSIFELILPCPAHLPFSLCSPTPRTPHISPPQPPPPPRRPRRPRACGPRRKGSITRACFRLIAVRVCMRRGAGMLVGMDEVWL